MCVHACVCMCIGHKRDVRRCPCLQGADIAGSEARGLPCTHGCNNSSTVRATWGGQVQSRGLYTHVHSVLRHTVPMEHKCTGPSERGLSLPHSWLSQTARPVRVSLGESANMACGYWNAPFMTNESEQIFHTALFTFQWENDKECGMLPPQDG